MNLIEWKQSYSVGHEILDAQHRRYIQMFNTLVQYEGTTVDSEIISEMLSELIHYAELHFKTEEDYLRNIGYPDFETHKKEHRQFIRQVSLFCLKTMEKDASVPNDLRAFLSDWWIYHIQHSDRQFKIFRQTQAASSSSSGRS